MKILSAQQVRDADAFTIKNEPISSVDLMERAAKACVDHISKVFGPPHQYSVFCGLGNNGGDGLAIARMLFERGNTVNVHIVRYSDKCSEDFLINEKRLKEIFGIKIHEIKNTSDTSTILNSPSSIVIDALFGSGLNKPVEGLAADVIHKMNASGSKIISIDIPSGLFVEDNSKNDFKNIVKADLTLTFQQPKLSFVLPKSGAMAGEFKILDIGLDKNFIAKQTSNFLYVTDELIRSIYEPRKKFSHKGTYGHALIVSGSFGKMGAAELCAKACLRAGAGLVSVYIPKCGYEIMQTALPEVMVAVSEELNFISGKINIEKNNAVGIGPGIGTEKQTASAVKLVIQNSALPLVIDADALNIIAENKTWISFLPNGSILTPHPKEFERLVGKWSNDEERLKMQIEFSIKHNVYLVLKGANTSVSCPDGEVYFNSTGNPGMAKGGSGDVLTGIITALCAQGYDPKQAAVFGVYLHGLAGDLAAKKNSEETMIASDIIENLGEAFKKFSV